MYVGNIPYLDATALVIPASQPPPPITIVVVVLMYYLFM